MDTQVDKLSVYSNCVDPVGWDQSANMPKPTCIPINAHHFQISSINLNQWLLQWDILCINWLYGMAKLYKQGLGATLKQEVFL